MQRKQPWLRLGSVHQRELFAFGLYRLLEAALLLLLAFGPDWLGIQRRDPGLLQGVAVLYFCAALLLIELGRISALREPAQASIGLAIDIAAALVTLSAQQGFDAGVALLLLFNITIASLLLDGRTSLVMALAAVLGVLLEHLLEARVGGTRSLAETVMYTVCYVAGASLSQYLRREIARSEALADERGTELARLAEVNELVIRRMRTGVLVLDAHHRIRVFNEAAWALLNVPMSDNRDLAELAPPLHEALKRWRRGRGDAPRSLRLSGDGPELLPRFVALGLREELFLVFLDDSRVYSGRAEELTLATLGRLAASIAHEVRNPLTAIQHAAQLLDESTGLDAADRRLLEIILNQCRRMDGIVQNTLGLARRERSHAERTDIGAFVRRFVHDYRAIHPDSRSQLEESTRDHAVALVDPKQLHQVLTVLVSNALHYGRLPGKPPQVRIAVSLDGDGRVLIDVIDHGPGIPPAVAEHLFEPFFTTSEHGTGLGLYIAQQLCEANQATLSYVPMAGSGACFRLRLASSHGLLADDPARRFG